MNTTILAQITELIDRHAKDEGSNATSNQNLSLTRTSSYNNGVSRCPQSPIFAMVLQGRISVELGGKIQELGLGDYLFISFDVPVAFQILETSLELPCLAFGMTISSERLQEVLSRMKIPSNPAATQKECSCVLVDRASSSLLDATHRLLNLLDTPDDVQPLTPLIEQEIIYRLLCGPYSGRLLQLAVADSPTTGIKKAIDWLRSHYMEPLHIPKLASQIGMSESSLHHHFKAVTGLTPMQYQKQFRLHEARRLIQIERLNIGGAGFEVGYQSQSQFTREYKRFYGISPRQHSKIVGIIETDEGENAALASQVIPNAINGLTSSPWVPSSITSKPRKNGHL